jgi:hypothetical protein
MQKKIILIFVIVFVLVIGMMAGSGLLSEKIQADLLKDMAEKGYFQKEINGKVLWTKDGY